MRDAERPADLLDVLDAGAEARAIA